MPHGATVERVNARLRTRTATIHVMPEPADDDSRPRRRRRGRPRLGEDFTLVVPDDVLEDARELFRKREFGSIAEPLRQWLVDGHAAWRRQR